MTRMEIWLLCFLPFQIGFDIYMLAIYGSLGRFMKHTIVKAMRVSDEEYERIHSSDKNR